VDPLGDFIEVEILLEDGAPAAEVKEAEREVRGILEHYGIPASRVEPRLYIDLLRRHGTGRPG
jgi:adenylate cyclase class IV